VAPVEVAGAEAEVEAAVVLEPALGVELELEQAAAVRARTPTTAPVTDLRSIGTSPKHVGVRCRRSKTARTFCCHTGLAADVGTRRWR
jgi:hypothetical protein